MALHRSATVDSYISKAQPFAGPILTHLRDCLHHAAPGVEEAMKWSRPFFLYKGIILGNFAAFKAHCSFGLWGTEMVHKLQADGIDSSKGMGTFGRITQVEDLPPRTELESYIRHAAALIAEGSRTKSIQRVAKSSPRDEGEIPAALAAALGADQAAAAKFAQMSSSSRREYSEWIAEAKREQTRTRRIAAAIQMISEGKGRNWKYERPSENV